MAEKTVAPGRPWCEEEDHLLRHAVQIYGEVDSWKAVSLLVPGRTNKACRKRWLHSLSPAVKKTAWTLAEDQQLLELYAAHGPKWSAIARHIEGRTDDACSKRYREALDPRLKKDEWTTDEDTKLLQAYASIGGKWGQVGQQLQRSGLGCRNRWRLLERNRLKAQQHDMESATSQPELMQVGPEIHYYPREMYPPSIGDSLAEHIFAPIPFLHLEPPPPFNFSSSSLSAALSDPPRAFLPLPPVDDEGQPESEPEPPPSVSSSSPHVETIDESNAMSLDDAPVINQDFVSGKSISSFNVCLLHDPSCLPCSVGGSHLANRTPSSMDLGPDNDRTLGTPDYRENLSSGASTPFDPPSQLSPTSSPQSLPNDLPGADHPPDSSLLFSSHYVKRPKKVTSKRRAKSPSQLRLSAVLPVTSDRTMRPYACGHTSCWPENANRSQACFATAKELSDHSKGHRDYLPDDKPFRCSLASCGKSWKSINGLQYHLQISTSHFRDAVSSRFSEQAAPILSLESQVSEAEPVADDSRSFLCPHPQCFKAYRQQSGLRYHLIHGHPDHSPAQIAVVPPTIARQMPTKTKKMRRKDSPE